MYHKLLTSTREPYIKHHYSLLVLLWLIFFCYSNTFHASWHLDDRPNITDNIQLHIDQLSFSSFSKTLTANPISGKTGTRYRPVPMFTFAINWYYDGNNTFSYHITNISIHIITAFFLYLTIFHLFTKSFYSKAHRFSYSTAQLTALLAVLLWALNPIQTQAITYIVQRMASMAAMFYIMAIFFYLQARSSTTVQNKIAALTITTLCFLLAIGSKENAVTLPITIVLLELLFLQNPEQKKTKQRLLLIFCSVCILLIIFGSFFFLNGEPLSFLNGYKSRSFTFVERMLTESRVVLHYLYQIFYPVTSHLSFAHDIALSQSLLKPWTTLPAIITLSLILISGLLCYHKAPFYSFAVLFFFLNHIIESTIIPLELIFEHRNYLPSMFLFVPIAIILLNRVQYLKKRNPLLSKIFILFTLLLVLISGFSTYSRNEVWATEETLWKDAQQKAPKNSRVAHNLARWYLQRGQYNEALTFFIKAEQFADNSPTPNYTRANALNGQGAIYYYKGNPERAIESFRKALTAHSTSGDSLKNLALTFLQIRHWPEALEESSKLVAKYPNNPNYAFIHAIALLRNKQPESSLTFAEIALQKSPNTLNFILTNAAVHKDLKQYHKAKHYLHQYDKIDPGKMSTGLALFEISIQEQDNDTTEKMKISIQQKYSAEELSNAFSQKQLIPLYSHDIIGTILVPTL